MTPATHVVLIRGINVGGKNPVPMAGLRSALEAHGYDGVRTYIQSGNVVLSAPGATAEEVSSAVEALLEAEFGVVTRVLTVTAATLRSAMADAPDGFGTEPDVFHYDVAFLLPGTTGAGALPAFGIREGVDTAWAGADVVYFRRLSALRTKSKLSTVMSSPLYKLMTVRNWRTSMALLAMLDEA